MERFGDGFDQVHLWLDELFYDKKYGIHHRRVRHNKVGIEQVRRMWGDMAAEAAKQHILEDIRGTENRLADEYSIPNDEEDYVARGYF